MLSKVQQIHPCNSIQLTRTCAFFHHLTMMAQWVKNLPAIQETLDIQVRPLGWEHPLGKEMATDSSILA